MSYRKAGTVAAVIAVCAVTAALFWFTYPSLFGKKPIAPATQSTAPDKSGQILRALFPNGDWPEVDELDRFDRTEVIRVIGEAKPKAHNERATAMSFLQAALGHEYNSNRDILFTELDKCADKAYPHDSQCRFTIAEYLMELARRGDASVLPALFDITDKADGAFSQSLGGFYSDMLAERSQEFLTMLSHLPKKEQKIPCESAGWEDGGGMGEERVNEVRKSLTQLMRHQSLSSLARRCLSGVEAARKAADKNNRDIKRTMEVQK